MSPNLLNKYIWLVETLYKAKKIALKEINRRWTQTELSEGEEIPRRTFHSCKNAVEEMSCLVILCEHKGGYHYYIENTEEIWQGRLRNLVKRTISSSCKAMNTMIAVADTIGLKPSIGKGNKYV